MPPRATTVFGVICRRFMFGQRSVPPATNAASGPSPSTIASASSTVLGRRYENGGRRIMA
jgi:hypothetical protein